MFSRKRKCQVPISHTQVEQFIKNLKEKEKISDDEMTFELIQILRYYHVRLEPLYYTETGFPIYFCPPPPTGTPMYERLRMVGLF